jgi:SOS-response transcriptional repressor LexA
VHYDGAEIIKRIRVATGVKNQEAVARLLEVAPSVVSTYKKRDHVPAAWIRWLEKTQGINPDYLLTGKGDPKLSSWNGAMSGLSVKIPLIAAAHSRKGAFSPLSDQENWPRFDAARLASKTNDVSRLLLLKHSGQHMAPEVLDGDLVLFDQGKCTLESGKMFVVRIEESITAHRILLGAGTIILRSESRDYPDQTVDRTLLGSPQFEVLGKALGVFRLYS